MAADDKELELLEELLGLIRSSVKTQVMFVAVETGIAEQLAGGPLSHTEVAARVECPVSAVKRLLNGMATFGLCVSSGDQYVLTDKGHLLLKVGAWAVWYGNCTWAIWGNLLYSVKTGRSAREFLAGLTGYDYLLKDSRMAGIFNLSMGQMSRFVGKQCVRKYQGFRDGENLLDVGGGYGALAGEILKVYPKSRAVVYDLAHALDGAHDWIADPNVLSRMEFVTGTFF